MYEMFLLYEDYMKVTTVCYGTCTSVYQCVTGIFCCFAGNQGNQWFDLQQPFTNQLGTSTFRIIIEGTVGTGYTSDIAIDNVNVCPGSCTSTPGILVYRLLFT